MNDKISRTEVLIALCKRISYYAQILVKCEELGSEGPTYNDAKTRIDLLLDLMVEIEGL